jgi:peptidyl-tRNA hydrolase, PTH2 family
MIEPKQVIIMRTDTTPKMRKGKQIAQGAHASLAVLLDAFFGEYGNRSWSWSLSVGQDELSGREISRDAIKTIVMKESDPIFKWINNSFVKIVVGGTLSDVTNCYSEAKKQGIPCSLIEDKGLTEFGGKVTITCCAIGPDDPEKIDKITGHLKLL